MSRYQLVRNTRRYGVSDTATSQLTGPPQIAGIRHRFKADSLGLGLVTTWVDSINGFTYTQATTSKKPTKNATGVLFSAHTLEGGTTITMTGDHTIFIVYGLTTALGNGSYGSILVNTTGDGLFTVGTLYGTSLTKYGGGDHIFTGEIPINITQDVLLMSTTTTSYSYANGEYSRTVGFGDASFPLPYMGNDSGAGYPYKGYIMELAIYNTLLTADDAANLHNYRVATYPLTF